LKPKKKKKKKKTIHRKETTYLVTTFTTFRLVDSSIPMTKMIFDPSVASDAQILNLYNEVTKESTSIWKREMKDGDRTIRKKG
jgi:hypothetical protein